MLESDPAHSRAGSKEGAMTTPPNEVTQRHALAAARRLVARNGWDNLLAIVDREDPAYAT